MMKRRLGSQGDTIVEVLVAAAVTASVIAGAYVVVNHTLANSRQAQEHAEVLKLLEGQLELVAGLAKTPAGASLYSTANKVHCIDSSGNVVNFSAGLSVLPTSYANYPATCVVGPLQYHIGIVYDNKGTPQLTDDTFTAYATWDGATGLVDEETLAYKVYP